MDNKDFDEVEDIFGTDIEENYDVPVFDPQSNIEKDEVPTSEEVKPVEEVPVYNDVLQSEPNITVDSVDSEASVIEESPEVQSDVVEDNTQTDVFDVQPEITVDKEEVKYGPVAVETSYEEEVNVHPDSVVTLNNNQEEKDATNVEDVPPINIADNKSLKFVFIIGVIILIAIFLLPLANKLGI